MRINRRRNSPVKIAFQIMLITALIVFGIVVGGWWLEGSRELEAGREQALRSNLR